MQLLGADKYSPDKLEELERFVEQQATSSSYSLDANLALLRLYQFNPAAVKLPVLAKLLLKALSQLPKSDFHTCIKLVPERIMTEDVVQQIIQLATALDTTRFADFWSVASGSKDLVASVPGFSAAVRQYILHVLGMTFSKVRKQVLGQALQLEGAALDALVSEHVKSSGWQSSGDIVTLPKNDLNTPVVVKRTEQIRFEQIAPVLRCVTAGL